RRQPPELRHAVLPVPGDGGERGRVVPPAAHMAGAPRGEEIRIGAAPAQAYPLSGISLFFSLYPISPFGERDPSRSRG
ncbi:MAG: hypothetical protein NTY16_10080, partial [Deltaproteobacteria bacterium]|nr:hypothetical protein [Deltaproteobacteria bacterium]